MLDFVSVNWWAVAAATVAQLIVGGIWNGLIFPRAFFDSHDVKEKVVPHPAQFVIMVGFTVINTYILSLLFENLFVESASDGMILSFWFWLAFLVPFIVGMGFATDRKKAMALQLGHSFLSIMVAGLVLGFWQ